MNKLIKNIIKYQQTKDNDTFNKIIKDINYIINKNLKKIEKKHKDDLKQEILMSIFKVVNNFKIKTLNTDLSYIDNFKEKYKHETNYNLEEEYNLFCNENQFRRYIEVLCKNKVIDFIRKEKHENVISLNNLVDENNELLDMIKDEEIKEKEITYSSKDLEFLNHFIEDDRILTQKEVGEKLGISQQVVSYKIKKIKNNFVFFTFFTCYISEGVKK